MDAGVERRAPPQRRQMAVISAPLALTTGTDDTFRPYGIEGAPSAGTVVYDDDHTYLRTAAFDHAGRPISMTLPADPDWTGMGAAPVIGGTLTYNHRGLPAAATLTIDAAEYTVVSAIEYLRDGLVSHIEYGDGMAPAVVSDTEYDIRRRPVRMTSTRTPTGMGAAGETLSAVSVIHDQRLEWDEASNLTALIDERDPTEWPDSFRPQSVEIEHDSLYRVVSAMFHYSTEAGDDEDDVGSDWRDEAASSNSVDPMRPEPAPMVIDTPASRVRSLTWDWDWLGNMEEWTDDAQAFYERSIGDIENGYDVSVGPSSSAARPSALYVASNLPATPAGGTTDEGGWVELEYGVGGNVTRMTVHAMCVAATSAVECRDSIPGPDPIERIAELSCEWQCAVEQHYEYRWDELDRIAEARRWDRAGGHAGTWAPAARQRYRYDGANQRTVKESFDTSAGWAGDSRVALYVYPGDFERRGLERGATAYDPHVPLDADIDTETQYLVAGARLVWQPVIGSSGSVEREQRLTIGVTDLLGTTAASVDLLEGELLEVSTYYPNGARETLWAEHDGDVVPLEPMGFTGKEADEEVGLVYFGERYLIARVGRWASPDPLHVHASGGGEALNSYHYVSGNLLQARDSLGLQTEEDFTAGAVVPVVPGTPTVPPGTVTGPYPAGAAAEAGLVDGAASAGGATAAETAPLWVQVGIGLLVILSFGALFPGDSPSRPPVPVAPAPPSSGTEVPDVVAGSPTGEVPIAPGRDTNPSDESAPAPTAVPGGGGGSCGPGTWEYRRREMSEGATEYEDYIRDSGDTHPGYTAAGSPEYRMTSPGGTALFDGVRGGGSVLLDAKSALYESFVGRDGSFRGWWRGRAGLVDEATRQLTAADGCPIEWHVESERVAEAMRRLLAENGISGIAVVTTPMP